MPAQDHLLKKAITLCRAGDEKTARQLLLGVLRNDECNQAAWLWYIETFSGLDERLEIYQRALTKNPQMTQVRRAYQIQQRLQQRGKTEVEPRPTLTQPVLAAPQVSKTVKRPSEPAPVSRPKPQHSTQSYRGIRPSMLIVTGIILVLLAVTASAVLTTVQERIKVSSLQQENSRLETNYRLTVDDLLQVQQNNRVITGNLERETAQNVVLTQRLDGLTQQYTTLNTEHLKLIGQYQALDAEHLKLEGENQALNNNYSALSKQYQDLEDRFTTLTDLNKQAVFPPYIIVHQREVTMSFYKLDRSILHWTASFESLERDIERGYASRRNLASAQKVKLNGDDGNVYEEVDFRPYVDPSVFTNVISELYKNAGSDETFIREVWNIVTQLTYYTSDPDVETPRYPLETLLAGGGDCEDTSILFASMVKAAPVPWKVSLIYLNADQPDQLSEPNHVMVNVDTGSAVYAVETTSSANMTPFPHIQGWFLEVK